MSGDDDATITAPPGHGVHRHPILLRWFPDPGSFPGPSSECLGNHGAAGYVQAYRDIVHRFRSVGADNVASCGRSTPTQPELDVERLLPGSTSVDWIAADGYDRSTSPPTVGQVQNLFGAWYSAFSRSASRS